MNHSKEQARFPVDQLGKRAFLLRWGSLILVQKPKLAGLLKQLGHLEELGLLALTGDKLDPQRQALVANEGRQGDRRLAGQVGLLGEG